jgi:hypothetical protein
LHSEEEIQQPFIGICWQTPLLHISVVQGFPSFILQVQVAVHELVSKVHELEHFNVPVYPLPITPAQVAPPKLESSHFSVASITPFPQLAAQLLSFKLVHPLFAGQHPSLFMQLVIEV